MKTLYYLVLCLLSAIVVFLLRSNNHPDPAAYSKHSKGSVLIDESLPLASYSAPRDLLPSISQNSESSQGSFFSSGNSADESARDFNKLPSSEQASLWKAFSEARREVRTIPDSWRDRSENVGYDFYALHPKQNLTARFGAEGIQIVSSDRTYTEGDAATKTTAWEAQMRLVSFAGDKISGSSQPQKSDQSSTLLEYHHSSELTEWFDHGTEAIEHGYTIATRPANLRNGEEVELEVVLEGLEVAVRESDDESDSLVFLEGDREVLSYSKLLVVDVYGKRLPASMKPTDLGFSITYDDALATYPVIVDPLIVNEQYKMSHSGILGGDSLGHAVAISEDGLTAVIGAYRDDDAGRDSGAVYIFANEFGFWMNVGKYTASDAAVNDNFGISVAISGETIVIGTNGSDDGGIDSGAVYVFSGAYDIDNPFPWAEQGKLIAPDAAAGDSFGSSVGVSGETVVIGAPGDDDGGGESGSGYIFTRSGSTWSQQAKLTASDAGADDNFGWSASMRGNDVVIGAHGDDDHGAESGSAYVFTRIGSTWSQQAKLTALDAAAGDLFGQSVAMTSDALVVGASQNDDGGTDSGSAYVFTRSGTIWSQEAKLTASDAATDDAFGTSVAIYLNTVVVGACGDSDGGSRSGSAYVFSSSGSTWSQQAKLVASDASPDDQFGKSVAISADSAVVGASASQENGSVYFFSFDGGSWFQQDQFTNSSGGGSANFGNSVSVFDDTVIIGAFGENVVGIFSGAAYVFTRSGEIWSHQSKLVASDAAAGDRFGSSVGISGDTVVIGSSGDGNAGDGIVTGTGSAYIFNRSGTTWSQQAKLMASNAENGDSFGAEVAISGDFVVVGAWGNDDGGDSSGSAYIFNRTGSTWSEQAKLTALDAAAGDYFGSRVAISGDTVVIGAYGDDDEGNLTGSAYVFNRGGSSWTQQAKLVASDAAADDYFGRSVAISGDIVFVGAPFDDDGGSSTGSVYVFGRSDSMWSQQAKLNASNAVVNGRFGTSVSVFEDSAVIGDAFWDFDGTSLGSVYFFTHLDSTWSQQIQFKASDEENGDSFGGSLAIHGDTVIIGASGDDDGGSNTGSAYIFRIPRILSFDPMDVPMLFVNREASFPDALLLGTSQTLTFRLSNAGPEDLDIQSISIGGVDAGQFSLTLPDISSTTDLVEGQSLFYTITFNPTGDLSGFRNAIVIINSNDSVPEFTFTISGLGLSSLLDEDSDGMNDWPEYLFRSFGFDWQTTQSDEVNFYYDNASTAGLYTQSEAAAITGSVELVDVDSDTNSAVFIISWLESLDLNNSTKQHVNPANLSVDGDGNIRFEIDAAPQKKFYRGQLER